MEQAIMSAAEELFLEKGYDRTSTVEIAKRAGCNQSLVHYYYRSKKNLFSIVFRKKVEFFLSSIMRINEEDLSFEVKMEKRISAHFDFIKSNWKLPVIFFNEIVTNSKIMNEIFDSFSLVRVPAFKQLQYELDTEYEKGNIRKTKAVDFILTVFSINLMTFIVSPVLKMVTKVSDSELENMIDERKKENIKVIMNSLKP